MEPGHGSEIRLGPGCVVRQDALLFCFAQSGGPGGQNVNKRETRVQLRVRLEDVQGLDAGSRARLARLAGSRLVGDGELSIVSQQTRSQVRNREHALDELRELVREALIRPVPRRPTRPTRGSVERRLSAKKATARRKQERGPGGD